jgi:nicotinate-nucleotide adenylyltransferase
LYLAKKICQKLRLSRVIFIPTYIPPHKKGSRVTQPRHRYNMLKLAIEGNRKFKLSNMEIKRKGRSYSVETLRRLKKKYGAKTEFFFIAGSDSLKELNKWKNLGEILKLCTFVVVERPGFRALKIPENIVFIKINARDVSATDIRNRIKKGMPLASLIPAKAAGYARRNKLYI